MDNPSNSVQYHLHFSMIVYLFLFLFLSLPLRSLNRNALFALLLLNVMLDVWTKAYIFIKHSVWLIIRMIIYDIHFSVVLRLASVFITAYPLWPVPCISVPMHSVQAWPFFYLLWKGCFTFNSNLTKVCPKHSLGWYMCHQARHIAEWFRPNQQTFSEWLKWKSLCWMPTWQRGNRFT